MFSPTPNPCKIAHHVCTGDTNVTVLVLFGPSPSLPAWSYSDKLRQLFLSPAVIKKLQISCRVLLKAATSTSPSETDEGIMHFFKYILSINKKFYTYNGNFFFPFLVIMRKSGSPLPGQITRQRWSKDQKIIFDCLY